MGTRGGGGLFVVGDVFPPSPASPPAVPQEVTTILEASQDEGLHLTGCPVGSRLNEVPLSRRGDQGGSQRTGWGPGEWVAVKSSGKGVLGRGNSTGKAWSEGDSEDGNG